MRYPYECGGCGTRFTLEFPMQEAPQLGSPAPCRCGALAQRVLANSNVVKFGGQLKTFLAERKGRRAERNRRRIARQEPKLAEFRKEIATVNKEKRMKGGKATDTQIVGVMSHATFAEGIRKGGWDYWAQGGERVLEKEGVKIK